MVIAFVIQINIGMGLIAFAAQINSMMDSYVVCLKFTMITYKILHFYIFKYQISYLLKRVQQVLNVWTIWHAKMEFALANPQNIILTPLAVI